MIILRELVLAVWIQHTHIFYSRMKVKIIGYSSVLYIYVQKLLFFATKVITFHAFQFQYEFDQRRLTRSSSRAEHGS